MEMYATFKYVHVIAAVATISGFILRGIWMLKASPNLQHPAAKIAPHILDTVFLLAGLGLLWLLRLNPLTQPWLLAKFAGLFAYVLLGMIAIRRGPTKRIRTIALVSAVLAFVYVVGVATAKSPLSWLAM